MLQYPKMILFDYGHTLLYEPDIDTLRGERELFRFVRDNPNNVSPEQADAFAQELFRELDQARKDGFEVHEYPAFRYIYEYLGLTFRVSLEEAERIFFHAAFPGEVMPESRELLRSLKERGIRTAVIRNISFSGSVLTERINALLPENEFEFILASSEYCFRKPSPRLFRLALRKAGLEPEQVWYCGDNPVADVEGASRARLYPVWFDSDVDRESRCGVHTAPPSCEHLHIRHWHQLLAVLDRLSKGKQ